MLSQDALITVTVETLVALPIIGFYCGSLYQNINLSMLRKSVSLYESQRLPLEPRTHTTTCLHLPNKTMMWKCRQNKEM